MEYQFSRLIDNVKPSAADKMLEQMNSPYLLSLAGGNPSAETFPVDKIQKISATLLQEDPIGMLQYSTTEGYTPLRETAKIFFQREAAFLQAEDDVIITSGSQQVPDLVAKCFCECGDSVLVENPSYYLTLDTFRSHGLNLVGVRLCEDGMDLEDLKRKIRETHPKLLYCIPNFHNPTGITTTEEKRKAIYEICAKYNVLILEDDPYGDIRFTEYAIPPIKSYDKTGLVILAKSFSKIVAPGIRVAACIANREVVKKLVMAKRCSDVHTAVWGQRICERLLAEIDVSAHLSALRKHYREKCQIMTTEIDAQLPEDIQYIKPQGGMFLWLTLPERYNMLSVVNMALEKNVAVVPGNIFYINQQAPCHCIRLNYSTPSKEDIKQGIKVLQNVL